MATLQTAISTLKPLMRSSISKASLTQSLTTPAKVAHMFDWKKTSNTILTLHVTKQAIECAIASHPTITNRSRSSSSFTDSNSAVDSSRNTPFPVTTVPSIPLSRDSPRDVTEKSGTAPSLASFHAPSVAQALQEVVQDHNVCGIIVVYPTNTANGCNNAACGRALHVLDHLSFSGSNGTVSAKPICLYDPNAHYHHTEHVTPDEWGRSPLFSTTTTEKVVHCAKQPQSEKNGRLLQESWHNFVHQYWPDVNHNTTTTAHSHGVFEVNEYDDNDLSEFIAKLSKNKAYISSDNRATNFHMNVGGKSNEHKKNLVYQSVF